MTCLHTYIMAQNKLTQKHNNFEIIIDTILFNLNTLV